MVSSLTLVRSACPPARANVVVESYAKFGFEDNHQRRNSKPENVGGETRIRHQGTPVDNVWANLIMNNVVVQGDAGVVVVRKFRR